jgi:hypothetical protein
VEFREFEKSGKKTDTVGTRYQDSGTFVISAKFHFYVMQSAVTFSGKVIHTDLHSNGWKKEKATTLCMACKGT